MRDQVDEHTVTVSSEAGTYTLPRNGDTAPCVGAGGDEEGNVAGTTLLNTVSQQCFLFSNLFYSCVSRHFAEKDEDFPEKGYGQMTNMKNLSDAELNRNLECFFKQAITHTVAPQPQP